MKPALKLDVMFAHFPYSGNGGTSSEIPQIRRWELETALKIKADPRIDNFYIQDFSDTPITFTRNKAIRHAKEIGAHLLLMIDSDNDPLKHAKEPWHRPFWDEAFNFIYERYHKGPHVVFAPYCGPPGCGENVYVFGWRDRGTGRGDETEFSLEQYTREHASMMSGIQEAAAGPTGLMLIDLRAADLVAPKPVSKRSILEQVQAGTLSVEQALMDMKEGYFYYEWADCRADEKASTEDVTFTRDIALAGTELLGYNPLYCAWDSWIGHHKPWNVGRPQRYMTEQVGESLRKAVLANSRGNELIMDIGSLNAGNSPVEKRLRELVEKHQKNGEYQLPCPERLPLNQARNPGNKPLEHEVVAGYHTARTDTGLWHEHGHAPEEQRRALADLVRSEAYRKNRQLRILEVGSWLGSTAIAMADAVKEVVVHCVDTWEGTASDVTGVLAQEAGGKEGVYAKFLANIDGRLNKKIVPWQKSSAEAAAMHWEPFDIIFIDADHSYEGVKADIENWLPHLREDGVMCGHDYEVHGHEGLTRAVQEAFGERIETFGWHPQGAMWKVRKAEVLNGQAQET